MRTHGIASTYRVGCRCKPCTDANTDRGRTERQQRRAISAQHPEKVPHGRYGYTNWGCRCDVCTGANSLASKEGRARRKAVTAP